MTGDELSGLLVHIHEAHRLREDMHRPELRLGQQIGAVERRIMNDHAQTAENGPPECVIIYAATLILSEAQLHIRGRARGNKKTGEQPFGRLYAEANLKKLARQLPVWPYVKETRGLGNLGFAQIVAECGNLSNYPTKGHLWKRMGLALLPDGTRQRAIKGITEEQARYIAFVPKRRAIMDSIGKAAMKPEGPYRDLYLSRKKTEKTKDPAARPIVHHKRALRYMEKEMLKHLWQAWRASVPPPETPEDA